MVWAQLLTTLVLSSTKKNDAFIRPPVTTMSIRRAPVTTMMPNRQVPFDVTSSLSMGMFDNLFNRGPDRDTSPPMPEKKNKAPSDSKYLSNDMDERHAIFKSKQVRIKAYLASQNDDEGLEFLQKLSDKIKVALDNYLLFQTHEHARVMIKVCTYAIAGLDGFEYEMLREENNFILYTREDLDSGSGAAALGELTRLLSQYVRQLEMDQVVKKDKVADFKQTVDKASSVDVLTLIKLEGDEKRSEEAKLDSVLALQALFEKYPLAEVTLNLAYQARICRKQT